MAFEQFHYPPADFADYFVGWVYKNVTLKLRQMFPKLVVSKDFGYRYNAGEISATQALFIVRRNASLFASKPTPQMIISFHVHACGAISSGLHHSHVGRGEVPGDSPDRIHHKCVGDLISQSMFGFLVEKSDSFVHTLIFLSQCETDCGFLSVYSSLTYSGSRESRRRDTFLWKDA